MKGQIKKKRKDDRLPSKEERSNETYQGSVDIPTKVFTGGVERAKETSVKNQKMRMEC